MGLAWLVAPLPMQMHTNFCAFSAVMDIEKYIPRIRDVFSCSSLSRLIYLLKYVRNESINDEYYLRLNFFSYLEHPTHVLYVYITNHH